jgi:large subunit ribosomal protein L29
MKYADLNEKSTGDLAELKASLKKEVFSFKMKNSVGQLEDTSLLGKTKKDLARIEQILTERSRASEGSVAEQASAAEGGKA